MEDEPEAPYPLELEVLGDGCIVVNLSVNNYFALCDAVVEHVGCTFEELAEKHPKLGYQMLVKGLGALVTDEVQEVDWNGHCLANSEEDECEAITRAAELAISSSFPHHDNEFYVSVNVFTNPGGSDMFGDRMQRVEVLAISSNDSLSSVQ